MAVGTPAYMSPEQTVAAPDIDGRSDIYSLGCVVYEMLSGRPPFEGSTAVSILARHSVDPVPNIRDSRTEIPESAARAVTVALSKSPDERFSTAGAFVAAFESADFETVRSSPLRRWWPIAALVVFAVLATTLATVKMRGKLATTASGSEGPSIAVLPFRNLDHDSASEAISDGISEEIATTIGRIPGLRVRATRSSFSLKGKNLPIPAIGEALGVGYVVDGSVQRGAGNLRIRAALLAAPAESTLWTGEYNRPAGDVFAVQDEIARAIANELSVRLTPQSAGLIARRATTSAEAHELYLRGRFFFQRRADSVALRKAREYFNLAIARDSSYAFAYAGLSDTYSHASAFGYSPPLESMPQATKYVERALSLDNTLAEAHTSRAFIATFFDWDWEKARQEFNSALKLDPRYPSAHMWRAWYFIATDSVDSAVRDAELAVSMEPFLLLTNTRLVSFLYYARRYNDALRQAQRTFEMDSTFFQIGVERARVLGELRRCDEAVRALELAPEQTAPVLRGIRGYTYAICGRRAEAQNELNLMRSRAREGQYVSHYSLAVVHAGLGDTDAALTELEAAFRERAWTMFLLKVDPAFDGLRTNPRFVNLVRRVGLRI
jgi:serine/threonine-protein kinase